MRYLILGVAGFLAFVIWFIISSNVGLQITHWFGAVIIFGCMGLVDQLFLKKKTAQ